VVLEDNLARQSRDPLGIRTNTTKFGTVREKSGVKVRTAKTHTVDSFKDGQR